MLMKALSTAMLAFFLANPLKAEYRPVEAPLRITSNNIIYTAQLNRDSVEQRRKTWYITDGRNLIGDEPHEATLFQDLAFTSTIARYTSLSKDLSSTLQEARDSFHRRILYHNIYDIANTTLHHSSQALGISLPSLASLATGGLDASKAAQWKAAKKLVKTAAGSFLSDIIEDLYVTDPNVEEKELAEKVKASAKKTALKQLELAAKRLDIANASLVNHKGYWNPASAAEFYSNWKSAIVYGQAYAEILQILDRKDTDYIGKAISYNAFDGLGIPEALLLKIPNVKRALASTGMPELSMRLEKEIEKNSMIFLPVEEYFNLIQPPPSHNQQPSNVSEYSASRRSKMLPLNWIGPSYLQQGTKEVCYKLVIANQGEEAYKSLEILLADITAPDGIKNTQQRLGLSAYAATDTKSSPSPYQQGKAYTIEKAICLQTSKDALQGKYTISYNLKFNSDTASYKSEQFKRTIEVR